MSTVTAFEAKTRFGDLLERVSRGEEIVITRHDKPVAKMIPEGRPLASEIQSAGRELRAVQDELRNRTGFRRLTRREIRDAIETGRR